MLSCSCEDYDADWYYYPPDDFKILGTKRGRRCSSCHELIKVGSECLEFTRERCPKDDIEEKIYGDGPTIQMCSLYHCEKCGEIFLNLDALGYCIDPCDNMMEVLHEYWKLTGFKPGKEQPC